MWPFKKKKKNFSLEVEITINAEEFFWLKVFLIC